MDLHMSGLSLEDDEEGLSLHLEGQATNVADQSLCLVGRFVTDRTIRTHIMNERLAEVWRSVRGVTIKEASPGLFIFQFFHKLDLEKVLKRGPWTFDNHLLVMARVHVGVPLQSIPLFLVDFWVQVHHLPAGLIYDRSCGEAPC